MENNKPELGLLVSMAIRQNHGLFMPYAYRNPEDYAVVLVNSVFYMSQLWEEVSGNGFWNENNNSEYENNFMNAVEEISKSLNEEQKKNLNFNLKRLLEISHNGKIKE